MLADCVAKVPLTKPRTFLDHVMTTRVWALSPEDVVLNCHGQERGQNIQRSAQEVLEILAGQAMELPMTAKKRNTINGKSVWVTWRSEEFRNA